MSIYPNDKIEEFQKLILTKFNIYNGLFLDLPYSRDSNIGELIPLLSKIITKGLAAGKTPQQILNEFCAENTSFNSEKQKIDFMFKVVQFIERQVVLYDAIEDAAFPDITKTSKRPDITDFLNPSISDDVREIALSKLNNLSTRLVFTAHPTQFYQPAVLSILNNLGQYVRHNQIDEINETLKQLGLTSLLNTKKLTPFDEAKNIIYYLRNVYYNAIGDLFNTLKKELKNDSFDNYNITNLGFWPGGDRDGNPFVTADITMQVADELRITLMKCYYHDIKTLQGKITFKGLDQKLTTLRDSFYQAMFDSDFIISYQDVVATLEEIKTELKSDFHGLFLKELDKFIDKVKIFKKHFATLDIRQDHSVHLKLITELLIQNKFIDQDLSELEEDELVNILMHQNIEISRLQLDDPLLQDTIKNLVQLPLIQQRNGVEACERYIISNSEDIFSVLFVLALLRWTKNNETEINFDVCPLFETMEGMRNSERIMRSLFDNETYRAHVKKRGDVQSIMLGYSDGTKDGGYLKANWSIYTTKENLTKVCNDYGIKVIFFDGRGGPPARGGGKTHKFYAAQSDLIANNEIQLTIQGQTITSTYGTSEQFIYNCRELITASLQNAAYGKENGISKENRALIDELANLSFEKYTDLKQHPKFLDYLEQKSTLKYYAKANIGSRPAKRKGEKKLTLNDLRAISFVGSWSQLKQNVPGYYGLGTAIQKVMLDGREDDIKKLFRDVPIFKALVLNSMMSLTKTNFSLTSYLSEDSEFGEFWQNLKDEFDLSKHYLLKTAGYSEFMEEEQFSKMSINVREKIVLPLLVIQQYALQALQSDTDFQDLYEKLVTRSLYGNINASRNSA
mgnify:CR=1 FL=1